MTNVFNISVKNHKYNPCSKEFNNNTYAITEVKLTGVINHFQDKIFFVISAFREEYNLEENLKRHENLKGDIKNKRLGFVELLGFWDEEKNITELSLLVPYKETDYIKSFEDFEKYSLELLIKAKQTAVIMYYPKTDEIMLLDENGFIVTRFDKLNIGNLNMAYSRARYGKHSYKYFYYEGYRTADNSIHASGLAQKGYIIFMK